MVCEPLTDVGDMGRTTHMFMTNYLAFIHANLRNNLKQNKVSCARVISTSEGNL